MPATNDLQQPCVLGTILVYPQRMHTGVTYQILTNLMIKYWSSGYPPKAVVDCSSHGKKYVICFGPIDKNSWHSPGMIIGLPPIPFWRVVPFFSQFVPRPVGLANGTANVPFSDVMVRLTIRSENGTFARWGLGTGRLQGWFKVVQCTLMFQFQSWRIRKSYYNGIRILTGHVVAI